MTNQQTNAAVYADLRSDTIAMVQSLTAQQMELKVPQSPDWSIRDVVGHVVGIIDDILSNNLDEIGTDSWTDAQVASRADKTLAEVCEEWMALAPGFEALGQANPVMAMRAGADLVTHHHDICQALGVRGDRESPAVSMGLERYGPFFCERADTAGLPIVRVNVSAPGEYAPTWQSADGKPEAVLTESAFELLRAFSGRRSSAQILAMAWDGDPEPYLDVVSPYGVPVGDVIE